MITLIYLENFQKHGKLKLSLDQVTTLIGDTDAGKSSILRALGWLCLNNLRGDGFIKKGEAKVKVSAKIDGKKLSRTKGKGNTYHLDTQAFKAVASSVPDEVARFLNLSPENFQEQIDPPFWFNLSPGQVSRELNSIINLDQIDSVLENIASWLRQAQQEKTSTERRRDEAKAKKDSLAWIVQARKDWDKIQEQEKEIAFIRNRMRCLEYLLEEWGKLVSFQENAKQLILDATKLKALLEEGINTEEKRDRLSYLLQDIESAKERTCHLTGQEKELKAKLTKLQKGKCPLCGRT